jgi:hypothetical protein
MEKNEEGTSITPEKVIVEEPKKTEEAPVKKEGFAEEQFVPKNKYNQTLRKLREMELEKIELAKKVATVETPQPVAPTPKAPPKKDVWGEEEEQEPVKPVFDEESITRIVEEKIKPIYDSQKDSYEKQRKNDRTIFFEKNPKYLESAEEFQELIEVLDRDINPKSGDSYFEQLEKARILKESSTQVNPDVESFKEKIAAEATNITSTTSRVKEDVGFTVEDKKIMKEYNISEEGMKAYKRKVQTGEMLILGMK